MEVTTTVKRLRGDLLIANVSGDPIRVGEYGSEQDDWVPLAVGSSVSIEGMSNGIGVVSDGVSEVGILPGGTGIFPPPVDLDDVDLSAYETIVDHDADLAGYVTKAMYDADTILIGDGDNNPSPISIPPGHVIGRGNSGNIKALDPTETAAIVGTSVYGQPQTLNAQTGTSYTPVAGDAGKLISLNNASAITVSLPQDSDATIAIGTYLDFYVLGVGQVTWQAGSGATLRVSGLTAKSRAQYSRVAAQKVAANTWNLFGDLAAS